MSDIKHFGFISSIHKDSLIPYYTTTSANQIISFVDKSNNQQILNSLTIEAENTPLYIQILPSEYCIFVPENGYYTLNDLSIKNIQVLGNSGQKLRWYGFIY